MFLDERLVRQVEQRRVELAVEPAAERSKGPGRRPRRPIPPPANELVLKDRWEDRLQGGALLLGVGTLGYLMMISMKAILLKLPDELVEAGDTCADSLGVSRAEYIRRAIDRMNHETVRVQRARDLINASKKVRAESARVNAEFDAIEGDVET